MKQNWLPPEVIRETRVHMGGDLPDGDRFGDRRRDAVKGDEADRRRGRSLEESRDLPRRWKCSPASAVRAWNRCYGRCVLCPAVWIVMGGRQPHGNSVRFPHLRRKHDRCETLLA